jgi:hypothetical protein
VRRALTAVAALLAPSPALACAACAAASSNRVFFIMTMVMSFLPLLLIGAGLWWIARHARERLRGEFEERDSLPAPVAAADVTPAPAVTQVPGVVGR